METYTKIKDNFDEIAKEISEKQKLYIENARRAGDSSKPTRGKRGYEQ